VANVPRCLQQWISQTRLLSPGSFELLPYDEGPSGTQGHPITHEDQLPANDASAYMSYYHNHRLLKNNQHLTGMIRFSLDLPWHIIKDPKKAYFNWLRSEGIFMGRHHFQMDTVAAAGWFFGVHPDVTRRDDSLPELYQRTGLPSSIRFQLSARTVNIPIMKNGSIKMAIHAIVVECDSKNVTQIREALFTLGDPATERIHWPVTGHFMFVPIYETKAWPHQKIVSVPKIHTKLIESLSPLYLDNIKDIDTDLEDGLGNVSTL